MNNDSRKLDKEEIIIHDFREIMITAKEVPKDIQNNIKRDIAIERLKLI